ncbi:MAG TPA: hypothetical protein VFL14_14900 [Xanthomonadales bacterium]|nr:hypothetical protein [Xanthomonadales bacterium]
MALHPLTNFGEWSPGEIDYVAVECGEDHVMLVVQAGTRVATTEFPHVPRQYFLANATAWLREVAVAHGDAEGEEEVVDAWCALIAIRIADTCSVSGWCSGERIDSQAGRPGPQASH